LRYDAPRESALLAAGFELSPEKRRYTNLRNHWIRVVHNGNGCQSAISCWCRFGETTNGAGSAIRMDGAIYPSVIENGSIARSTGETRRTLLAYLPGKELATGDVRRCINK
jgi:hypothetical protein